MSDDEPLHRGLYLLADTPATLHPVLTEDGAGDQGILTEMLAEEGVGTFGAARHEDELVDFILDTIDELDEIGDDANGAPFDDVLEIVVDSYGMHTTLGVVHDMLRTGRLYAPSKTTLRTTGYEPDHDEGLHA